MGRDAFHLLFSPSRTDPKQEFTTDANSSGIEGQEKDNKASQIFRPTWLDPGVVTVDHIKSARAFVEKAQQSLKGKIRDTPTPSGVAVHGPLRVYRQLGSHLHRSRENVKHCFFQIFIDRLEDERARAKARVLFFELGV